MKIVHMEVNNRHLKPKVGSYFTMQSPIAKSFGTQSHFHRHKHLVQLQPKQDSSIIVVNDGVSGTNSLTGAG